MFDFSHTEWEGLEVMTFFPFFPQKILELASIHSNNTFVFISIESVLSSVLTFVDRQLTTEASQLPFQTLYSLHSCCKKKKMHRLKIKRSKLNAT